MKLLKNIVLIFWLLILSFFLISCGDNSSSQNQEQIQQFQNVYFDYPLRGFPIGKTEGSQYYWECSEQNIDDNYFCSSYNGKFHSGEDWNLKGGSTGEIDEGKPVYSIGEGKVIYAKEEKDGLGNNLGFRVVIEHTGTCVIPAKKNIEGSNVSYKEEVVDKIYSVYLHLKDVQVKVGDEVKIDTVIGKIKKAGTGPHLHFEIRKEAKIVYESYFENIQQVIDSGFRDPSDFIEANMIGSKVKIGSPQTIPEESFSIVTETIAEESASETINIIKENPWPMLYHDPKFTKRTSYKGPDNPVEMWQLKFKNIRSNPVVDYSGTIYIVAVEDNKLLLFAVGSNGKIKWKHNLSQTSVKVDFERCNYYLALEQDGLIILSSSWGLSGIRTDGNSLWSTNIGDCNYRCPIIDENGNIYIVTNAKNSIEYGDDKLYCISKDGSINWQVDLKKFYGYNDFIIGSPDLILNNNNIFVGNGFSKIELQNNNSDNEPFFLNYSDSAIGYQNRIIFPCWESSLIYFMDFPSFNRIWEFDAQGFVFRPSIDDDGTIYFNAYNYDDDSAPSYLYSAKKDGGLNWSLELPSGIFPQMTIDSEGTVYLSVNHSIYAVYPDGSKKWVYEFSSDGDADQPIIGINNMLYFISGTWDSSNSILHAIGSKG